MIVCPNCNHQNPEGAVQCEACYTPLPAMIACPNCGSPVQTDASFCGQCGSNLKAGEVNHSPSGAIASLPNLPELIPPDPLIIPDSLVAGPLIASILPDVQPAAQPAAQPVSQPAAQPVVQSEEAIREPLPVSPGGPRTQLQYSTARLLHLQTNTAIELPQTLTVVHIGKPNDRIPPDVDVSGFPNSEIVSRIHADIRIEGDSFYIEDVGSSNGTYINNAPLPAGNRHRLRSGDRIALGKGDKVTFLFQVS